MLSWQASIVSPPARHQRESPGVAAPGLSLTGTWSQEEADTLAAAIAALGHVDADLRRRAVRQIAIDTNTEAGFKRGDPDCIEVIQPAELVIGIAFGGRGAQNLEALCLFFDCSRIVIKEAGLAQPMPTP